MDLTTEAKKALRKGQIKKLNGFMETINNSIFKKAVFCVLYDEEKDNGFEAECWQLIIFENHYSEQFGKFEDIPNRKGLFSIDDIYKEIVKEMDYMNIQEEINRLCMTAGIIKKFSGQNIDLDF